MISMCRGAHLVVGLRPLRVREEVRDDVLEERQVVLQELRDVHVAQRAQHDLVLLEPESKERKTLRIKIKDATMCGRIEGS